MTDSGGRRWWALIAVALSVLMVGLDLTVLNLALPTIATQLHASTGDLQWVSDAYSLVVAAAMLPAGQLGDRYGRKKLLLVALVLFGLSSVGCAYSASIGELIAARAILGIGAAAIYPMSLAIIPVMFAPEERQKALGAMAGATFISFPVGPVLGGFLLDHFWWGSVFLINVPIIFLALLAVGFLLPESHSERRPGIDFTGVILSSLALVGLTYGVIETGQNNANEAVVYGTIIGGVVLLVVFVLWERRIRDRDPLIDLGLFKSAGFTWGSLLTTLVTFAMFGLFFTIPQYFQDVIGTNAMGSGIRLLPLVGGMVAGMGSGTVLGSPRKTKSPDGPQPPLINAKVLVAIGFVIMAGGLAVGAFTKVSSGTGFAEAWIAISGFGLGFSLPQTMNSALGALTADSSGSGSALISAMRQVGATIGVAVLGAILSAAYHSRLNVAGLPTAAAEAARSSVSIGVAVARAAHSLALLANVRSAFVHAMGVMLWVCGGIALASAILALIFLPRHAGMPAEAADADTTGDAATGDADPGAGNTDADDASTDETGTDDAESRLRR